MTLIVALHLDDYIMFASDRRLSGSLSGFTIPLQDDYQKIQLWELGIMMASGDELMMENFCFALSAAAKNGGILCPYSIALAAKCLRMLGGESADGATGTAIFSLWNGQKSVLMEVHIENNHIIFDTVKPFHTRMTFFKKHPEKDVANILANKLLGFNNFNNLETFCDYHLGLIQDILKIQAGIDVTVSASFDWMIQDTKTGAYRVFNCPREEPMPVTTKIWVTTHIDPLTNSEKTLWNYQYIPSKKLLGF